MYIIIIQSIQRILIQVLNNYVVQIWAYSQRTNDKMFTELRNM